MDLPEVKFQLSSSYVRAAAVDSILAVLASGAAVAVSNQAGRVGFGGLDLAAGASSLYVLVMYCFQSSFLEWPEPGFQKPQGFLLASLGNLLLPNLLAAKGLWVPSSRFLSATLSGGLAVAAYNQLVRGPSYTPPRQDGKVFLVTGANSGIGYEACKAFALAGATVIFGCRDEKRATSAMNSIAELPGVKREQLHFLPVDLASLKSVHRCAELLEASALKVDVLVLNAGVMRRSREFSEDGFELTMAANHLGHFHLVQLLLPHLEQQQDSGRKPRVVMVGSNLCYSHDVFDFSELVSVPSDEQANFQAKPYGLFRAYAQSKLANLMMVKELSKRLGDRILVNCVHPGEVLTQVMNDMHPAILAIYSAFRCVAQRLFKSPAEGAVCTVFVATSPELKCTGEYFMRLRPAAAPKVANDPSVTRRLWNLSLELTQTSQKYNRII